MRAQRALLLAFAALVARTEADCPGPEMRDYDPNCIEDNMEPRTPMNHRGEMLDGSHEQVVCYVMRYPTVMREFCYGSVESCNDVKIIQHWNGHERYTSKTWGCARPPNPPPPPPYLPPPPVNCDDLDMREDLYNYNDEGLTEPLTCENIYAHPGGREKGCNAFYESMPGIGTNWGAREYIFCTLADDGSCKSSAPARCHMPKSVGAAAATAASCPQLAEAYNSRCSATAGDAYHEDGTLNLEHGTDDPTMCKLMDSVLAGHGFGMFVLGMLCGLACAFCAYLFITRCRSQGPKMGRARTMYSDSEVAGARGAQGDVPASEL
jgi:hypothetical protein